MKQILSQLTFVLTTISTIHAQDTTVLFQRTDFVPVTITYEAMQLTPITFQNIYEKQLQEKSLGQEPSFILSGTPSITNFSDAGNSQGYSYFRLRGIDQTRINITLDGMPLNEPEDQGAYFSNYPDLMNSVSRIQIQRGAGTTKNGVASFAGSIQLFSPNLRDSSKTTVGLSYGSFNSFRGFAEYSSGVKRRKAIYVRASQVFSDGYKYNSSNNAQSVFVSGGLFHNKSTWKLNLAVGQQKNELAWLGVLDSVTQVDPRTNANSEQEKDRFIQCLAQLQHTWKISKYSALQSSVYYTFLNGNYDFDFNNFLGFPSTEELYNYAFQSNLVGVFSNYTYVKNKLTWTTGVHGNTYRRTHTGSEKSLGELYQNTGFKSEGSVFTKAEYAMHRFTLFTDVQYRHVNFDYQGSVNFDRLNWNFINPKAGVSCRTGDKSHVYYSAGNTGREPTRNDMFAGNDDLLADSQEMPVLANTEPESVLDHELGWKYYQSVLRFVVNLYYMDFKNEIVLDGKFGPNGLALTNNVEQSIRTGAEFTILYKLNEYFTFINNSSFNYSRIKEQSETFSPILTPPLIINQEVLFTKNRLAVSVSGRYQHGSFIDFANEERIDGYLLLNSRVSYSLKGFNFSIFANNLTNARYVNQAYIDFDGSRKSFVQAPINLYGSIQYSF